jgi:hypothetical protein
MTDDVLTARSQELGELHDQVRSREGQEAVYRETGLIAVVRIHGLRYDHDGFSGTATVVRPPRTGPPAGPAPCGLDSWVFAAGREYFSLSRWAWSSAYGGWTLYHDAGLIGDLFDLGLDGCETIRGIGQAFEADRTLERFQRFKARITEFVKERRKLTGEDRVT